MKNVPNTVWQIGLVMSLVNMSFVMGSSYLGIYMDYLGLSMVTIGFVEGTSEAISLFLRFLSGMLSDYFRRRKPLMVIGYSMLIAGRVLLGFATSFVPFVFSRFVERTGSGALAVPRDLMVMDVMSSKRIGAAYGIKRTLSQAGSFLGAIVSMFAMRLFNNDIQSIFQAAILPAIIAYFILIFFIKEPKQFSHSAVSSEIPLPEEKRRHPISMKNLPLLGKSYWMLMLVAGIFMMARFGESFLCLYARKTFDLPLENVPLVMMVFNAAWCLTSYPVGRMADRMNRYWFLIMGIVFLVLTNMVLANADSLTMLWIGVGFWGVQYAITMNIFLVLIAEIVPENLRGMGMGCYYIICATSEFFAHVLAGLVAQNFGQSRMFVSSGLIGVFSLLVLIALFKGELLRKS